MYSENNFLIVIDDKDKTQSIDRLEWKERTVVVYFTFDPSKPFAYSKQRERVEYFKDPKPIDPNSCRIQWKGKYLNNIVKILDFGVYLKIFYNNGRTGAYKKILLGIEHNAIQESDIGPKLEYLHVLAKEMGGSNNDFLDAQYDRMSFVSEESVLYAYLKGLAPKKRHNNHTVIFPFGLNLSQEEAVTKALTHQVSIIEGPPGTGKTQTILNIIANLILQGKTVAVASNNNSATRNVFEKLEAYGLSFFVAVLGNADNKKVFFDAQTGVYPSNEMIQPEEHYSPSKAMLEKMIEKIKRLLHAQNDIARAKSELADLRLEKNYYMESYKQADDELESYAKKLVNLGEEKILSLLGDIDQLRAEVRGFTLLFKMKALFKYRLFPFNIYRHPLEEIAALLEKCFYEAREQRLLGSIKQNEDLVNDREYRYIMENYQAESMQALKYHLSRKYHFDKEREVFDSFVLKKDHRSFTEEYPVILSTTHSLRNCSQEEVLYDYLIIDETSQVDLVAGALALSVAKNVVIVGDNKQLPHVVDKHMKEFSDKVFEAHNVSPHLHFGHSLLSSIALAMRGVPRTILKEHYRCHPKIIDFCNKKFYNNELVILTKEDPEENSPLVLWTTVEGNHARNRSNQRQIDLIKEEILPLLDMSQTGIISPFRDQVKKMEGDSQISQDSGIEIDTVHKYQGREKDNIIISTVVNNENSFADDPNLLNVAVSRAKKKLFVVTENNSCNRNMKDLIDYIKYHRFEMRQSSIYSIFDLLYKNYSPHLDTYLNKVRKVSAFQSENLMATLIDEVLSQERYSNLSYIHNYPLSRLIRDTTLLSEREKSFVYSFSHIDFMVYNTVSKVPVLGIEVDGVAFHANTPKQKERDETKNIILKKYDIPIIRFSTDGSMEKERLLNKLEEII